MDLTATPASATATVVFYNIQETLVKLGQHGKLDQVTFPFIPDVNAALAALQAGDIDVRYFGLGPESVEVVRRSPNLQIILGETTSDVILALNNSRKPYSDVRMRRAITHAINKEEVVKGAMFGFGRILGTNIDPLNPQLRGHVAGRAV